MARSYKSVRRRVVRRIGAATLKSLQAHMKFLIPKLWAVQRPRRFTTKVLVAGIYKELYGLSYDDLKVCVHAWLPMGKRSFEHNQKELRRSLSKWGEAQISLGTLLDWMDVRDATLPDNIDHPPMLLIDSKDFPLKGKSSTSKKDMSWSYKANGPAQRYMLLVDTAGTPRYLHGGYSPKLYDGHWVEARSDWFDDRLAGATIYGDEHFNSAARRLHHVRLICPKRKPPRSRADRHPRLPHADRRLNAQIHKIRGRVELTFARVTNMFKSLGRIFLEDCLQQDALVRFAFGVLAYQQKNLQ